VRRALGASLVLVIASVLVPALPASAFTSTTANLLLHYWSALEWCPGSSGVMSWGLTSGDALPLGSLDSGGQVVGGDAAVEIFVERGTAPVTQLAMPGTTDPNTGSGATVTSARPKAKGILNVGTGSTWANGFGLQPELTTASTSGTGVARFGVAVITSATEPLSQALGITVDVNITAGRCLGPTGPDSTSQLTIGGASSFDVTGPNITMQITGHLLTGSPVHYVTGSFLDGTQVYETEAQVKWTGSDPSAVCDYQVWSDAGHGPPYLIADVGTSTSYNIQTGDLGDAGYNILNVVILAEDCAGNWSVSGYADPRLSPPGPARILNLPDNQNYVASHDDNAATYSTGGAWTHSTGAVFMGGSDIHAVKAGAAMAYTYQAQTFAWVGEYGPSRGSAKVYQDGILKATVSLYATVNTGPEVVWSNWFPVSGIHTIKVVVVGTAGHPRVDVDGFFTGPTYP